MRQSKEYETLFCVFILYLFYTINFSMGIFLLLRAAFDNSTSFLYLFMKFEQDLCMFKEISNSAFIKSNEQRFLILDHYFMVISENRRSSYAFQRGMLKVRDTTLSNAFNFCSLASLNICNNFLSTLCFCSICK